jgi:hypothetical protein
MNRRSLPHPRADGRVKFPYYFYCNRFTRPAPRGGAGTFGAGIPVVDARLLITPQVSVWEDFRQRDVYI